VLAEQTGHLLVQLADLLFDQSQFPVLSAAGIWCITGDRS